MDHESLIKEIKNHKKYKGQLLHYETVHANHKEEDKTNNLEFNHILDSLEFKLYKYQKKALEEFINNHDLFLVGGYGTGLSTTIDMLSMYSLLFQGKSVLYLEPSIKKLENKKIRLNERLCKLRDLAPAAIFYAESSESILNLLINYPDILITKAEYLYNAVKKDPNNRLMLEFLFSLGLVSIERIEMYNPQEVVFITNLIRLMNSLTKARFVITSASSEDYSSIRNLLETSISFELIDNKACTKDVFMYFWLPPFEVKLLEDKNTFQFKRRYFLDEINNILNIIEEVFEEDKRILIWHAFERLTSKMREKLSDRSHITVTNEISDLFMNSEGVFDIIIIIGMPKDFKHLIYNINGFAENGGLLLIIPPDDLLSYLLIWSNNNISSLPGRRLLHSSNLDFLRDKFDVSKKRLLGAIISDIIIPEWGVLADDFINVVYPSGRKISLDNSLLPFNYYQGKIIHEKENALKVNLEHNDQKEVIKLIVPAKEYVKSMPIIDFEFPRIRSFKRELTVTSFCAVEIIEARIFFKHKGNILFTDYSHEAERRSEEFQEYEYMKEVRGVKIKTKYPQEMEHLIYNFLPLLYRDPFEFFFMLCSDAELYIFPHQNNLFFFVEQLFYNDVKSTIDNLYDYAYKAIKECPCRTGCSKCIYYAYHRITDGLRKDEFGMELAKYSGNEEQKSYLNLIEFRNGSLTDIGMLTNLYNDIKDKVIDILQDNLDVGTFNPVRLIVVNKLDTGIVGLYDGSSVQVIPLTQQQAIGVIAHEYVHNWQDKIGILARDDKFLSEGSAQWLAMKVLNYYYRIDEIESEIMGTSFEQTKEYFNGFQFLQEVEEKFGYFNILKALIDNTWDSEQLKIRDKWEEYRLCQ